MIGGSDHVADVAQPILARDGRCGSARAERAGECHRHVAHRSGSSARDVAGVAQTRLERDRVRTRHVDHVHEIAQLRAVLEHPGALAALERAPDDARDPRVGRVTRHPRPVDVVVAECGDGRLRVLALVRAAQMLLV